MHRKVAIIGGGLSGLSAACALHEKGIEYALFEKHGRLGGVVNSRRRNGYLLEAGPHSMMLKGERLIAFLDKLGLMDDFIPASKAAKKRFILRKGEMVAVPSSPVDFLKSSLLNWKGKFRVLSEFWGQASAAEDESLNSFLTRRFGADVAALLADPMAFGVYAGDADQLSLKHAYPSLYSLEQQEGSLLKAMMKRKSASRPQMGTFQRGLSAVVKAMQLHLSEDAIFLGTEIVSISRSRGEWSIRIREAGGLESTNDFTDLVLACPAYAIPQFNWEGVPNATFAALSSIPYAPVATVNLGYAKGSISHPLDGFGLLIPRAEQKNILGITFDSTLFPSVAPDGKILLSAFVGGALNPNWLQKTKQEQLQDLRDELGSILGITEAPELCEIFLWPQGIPQYDLKHETRLKAMNVIEEQIPNLSMLGNYRHGVSLGDCIQSGCDLIEQKFQ